MDFLLLCKHPNHLKSLKDEAYHFEKFIHPAILETKKELKLTLNCF